MAAAWVCALDFAPPKVTAVIDKNTYTRELVEAEGSFAINIPCVAQAEMVMRVGYCSGRDFLDNAVGVPSHVDDEGNVLPLHSGNKFSAFGIETFAASQIDAPLVRGCVAWLECKIIPEPHNQNTYDLFIAEVVAAQADERVFSQNEDGQFRWHFEGHDNLRTIHHVAGGHFFTTGNALQINI